MDLYEVMKTRRSIRDFTNEVIPNEVLERILEAAYTAPSNDHFRDWHFMTVRARSSMKICGAAWSRR